MFCAADLDQLQELTCAVSSWAVDFVQELLVRPSLTCKNLQAFWPASLDASLIVSKH